MRALSRIFRDKFPNQTDTRAVLGQTPGEVWAMEWNVNCQTAGDGMRALQYPAPYVFKVATSERRIVSVDEHHVRFRYQKPQSNRVRTMTLPIMEFMRRFLQHVLPREFMKVRYYGFLTPTSSVSLADVKARIEMASGFAAAAPEAASAQPAALPSLRWCPAVLSRGPARRLRDRLARLARPAGPRVAQPQRRARGSLGSTRRALCVRTSRALGRQR